MNRGLRILHVPYSYYPDPAGGTEVYVSGLAAWQCSLGCEVAVTAPDVVEASYYHEGIRVWRFAVSPNPSLRELYGEGDKPAAEAFGRILDQFNPDIVHLHAFTRGISVLSVEQASQRGIPVFFNYHTPTVSCLRGTLLRWGSEVCDGRLDKRTCAACTLNGHGLTQPLATLISLMPGIVSRGLSRTELSMGAWTALRMPELVDLRIQAFHRLMQIVERVFALCEWTAELLVGNGVPENKITLCRQGISWVPGDTSVDRPLRIPRLPLRAAFLGRFDGTKGVNIIVESIRNDATLPVHLDLFGVRQGEAGNQYAVRIQEMIANDPRIRILPPLSSSEVIPRLRSYDFLVVPSQWLETGPLVVLEAFAAGTPVVGSDLGGIAELVIDGVNGLLVNPADSPAAWAESLRQLCLNPGLLDSLRAGVLPPRHSRQVAVEMIPLYADAIANRGARSTHLGS